MIEIAVLKDYFHHKTSRHKSLKCKKDIVLVAMGKFEMSSLKDTIQKIRNLQVEKQNLLLEIEELTKLADAKAIALENEVASLRQEAKSLRALMGQEQSVSQFKVN